MQAGTDLNTRNNLAEQSYWDEAYANMSFGIIPEEDIVRKWLEEHIPRTTGATCFEVGCFPGRYLAVFGELGYELNGLDLTPRVETDLPAWLRQQNYRVGTFTRSDIFTFRPQRQYDLVTSFGFIEHFRNWEEVVRIQASLVAPGGYLVIETPNFKGWFQRFLHLVLDYENYKRHYVPSMDPRLWKKTLEPLGFEFVFYDYLGEFQFWVNDPPKGYIRRKLFNQVLTQGPRLRRLKKNSKAYSPFCGLIAKKIKP